MPGRSTYTVFAAAGLSVLAAGGCRPGASRPSQAPAAGTLRLGERPLSQVAPAALRREPGDAVEAAEQLDVALDAFDAARFFDDPHARRLLAAYVGPLTPSRGPLATAEATERLLARAYRLAETADATLPDDAPARRFAADALALLAADAYAPSTAEDLLARVGAYRTVVELGHPAAADNARLRLFDFARGCLQAAAAAPAPRRYEIAAFALLAGGRDPSPLLDLPPRAAYPAAEVFGQILRHATKPLEKTRVWADRWRTLQRAGAQVVRTAAARLPAPRAPLAEVVVASAPKVGRGYVPPESLAPVLLLGDGVVTVEPGSAREATFPGGGGLDAAEVVRALEAAMDADGRGGVLLVAPAATPAPAFEVALAWLVAAGAERIELAVRPAGPRSAYVPALPVAVAGPGAGRLAGFAERLRLRIALGGTGPTLGFDGWRLSAPAEDPTALARLVARAKAAFPRERGVGLVLEPGAAPALLAEVLFALTKRGAPEDPPPFASVVFLPEAAAWPPDPRSAGLLALRARFGTGRVSVRPPYPLRPDDAAGVAGAAQAAAACLPELAEMRAPPPAVRGWLRFDGGVLQAVALTRPRRAPAAFEACLRTTFAGVRLAHHREAVAFVLEASVPGPPAGGVDRSG